MADPVLSLRKTHGYSSALDVPIATSGSRAHAVDRLLQADSTNTKRDFGTAMHTQGDVAALRLPAVDPRTAAVSRLFGDARIARFAAAAGVRLSSWVPFEGDLCPKIGDPVLLTISFSLPRDLQQRAHLVLAVDLEQHVELLVALGADRNGETNVKRSPRAALGRAVAALLLEPLLIRLRDAGFAGARLDAIERGQLTQMHALPVVQLVLVVDASAHDPARTYRALLALPPAALACVKTIAAQSPPAAGFFGLRVPGSAVVGVKPIAVDALLHLKPGDVLLRAFLPCYAASSLSLEPHLQNNTDVNPANAIAIWGTPGLKSVVVAVSIRNQSLIFSKDPEVSHDPSLVRTEADNLTGHAEDPLPMAEFELPVQFEIDTVAMSIGQLSSLRAGYVVELPIPFADARLRLVAHGQTIGYGELVTVGEHLGVRIVRMAHTLSSGATEGHDSIR